MSSVIYFSNNNIKFYTHFFLIVNYVGLVSHTQFSTIILIEPKLGRRLTQPLIDLISRFYTLLIFFYIYSTIVGLLQHIGSICRYQNVFCRIIHVVFCIQ